MPPFRSRRCRPFCDRGRLRRRGSALAVAARAIAVGSLGRRELARRRHPPGPDRTRETGALSELLPSRSTSARSSHLFAGELAAAAALSRKRERSPRRPGASSRPMPWDLQRRGGRDGEAGGRRSQPAWMRSSARERPGRGMSAHPVGEYAAPCSTTVWADTRTPCAAAPRRVRTSRAGLVDVGDGRAGRGRRPQRPARRLPLPSVDQLADMADTSAAPTGRSGSYWRVPARCVTDGDAAEPLYREAIERLDRTRVTVQLARAHLVYGEWLRRGQRRVGRPGAPAGRPRHVRPVRRRGVRRTGPPGAAGDGRDGAQAHRGGARRADPAGGAGRPARRPTGHTNPEIGAQLFISPRTAEYHLHKVFSKLDISSRRQLRARLAQLELRTAERLTRAPPSPDRGPHSGLPQMRAHPNREDAAS